MQKIEDRVALHEVEDIKEHKSPLPKNPWITLIIVGVVGAYLLFSNIPDMKGLIILGILIIIIFVLNIKREEEKGIPLNKRQAWALVLDELKDIVGASKRWDTHFPEGKSIRDVIPGNYDTQRDSLTFDIIAWHFGFILKDKDEIEHYYLAKVDYWIIDKQGFKGNGILAINELNEEFKEIKPIIVKLVPTPDYEKLKRYSQEHKE